MTRLLFAFLFFLVIATAAQTPCENGVAEGHDCYGIDLMSKVDVISLGAEELSGIWVNDIWGWTDPETGKEYALVGMTNGTSFVDISDPVNPVVLGVLREHNWMFRTREQKLASAKVFHDGAKSWWRDIKTYQNHAFIVSEDPNHGIQVFDLTELRDVQNPSSTNFFEESGHYNGIGKAHNLFINEDTGILYAVGFNQNDRTCAQGGLHMVDITDPVNPVYAGCYDNDGYTHDTQCVIYRGPDSSYFGKEICFSSNEDTITLTDVTDRENPIRVKKFSYSGAQYIHQGWLTEDHKYFISNDELDEANRGHNTRTYVWDVQNLDEPELIGIYEHTTASIDHNLYTKGNRVFQANYSSGLRILNLSGIEEGNLELDLFFDTYRFNNSTNFNGAWSNYPYFESGLVIVSDIQNGLFVLDPVDLIIDEDIEDLTVCEGTHLTFPLKVTGDEIEYQWQVNEGSGFENITDFERYHSTTKMNLHAHALSPSQSGNQYRCLMTYRDGDEYVSNTMTLTVADTAEIGMTYDQGLEYEVAFTNTTQFANSYSWDFGSGASSVNINPTYRFSGPGTYNVTLTGTDGCGERSEVFEVELASCDEVTSSFSYLSSGLSVDFTSNSSGGAGVSNYIWDFGDGTPIVESQNPSHTYSQGGDFIVQLISHDGCDADTTSQSVSLEALTPLNVETSSSFSVYPNPSSGSFEINLSEPTSGELRLISITGQLIQTRKISVENTNYSFDDLQAGIYLVEIKTGQKTIVQKVVVK